MKTVAGKGKKSSKFWAPHPSGPHPSGPPFGAHLLRAPLFSGLAPHPLGPHHDTHQIQKQIGQNWIGQNWPGQNHDGQKWIGQNWIGQNWSNQDGQNGIGQSRSLPVVLAIEVGGRWSPELQTFVAQLAKSKAREQPFLLQKRFEQAWRMRWGAFLACAAAKAVATCLLDLRCAHGADGHTPPAWEVEADHRHMGLAP